MATLDYPDHLRTLPPTISVEDAERELAPPHHRTEAGLLAVAWEGCQPGGLGRAGPPGSGAGARG